MSSVRHFWRIRALAGLALAALTLAACTTEDGDRTATGLYRVMNSDRNPGMEVLQNTTELSVVPTSRALVHAPEALLLLERNLGGALDQRVVLPNRTSVPGDNLMLIRAQTSDSARPTEFNFEEIAARFGGMPVPFQRIEPGGLLTGSDAMGSYVYARENLGVDTICVLVLRRIGANARPLPRNVHALDVILRNCVVGTVDQALAPMSDRALAIAAAPQGTAYTLSPFAAPTR
jgi:hypothetical protein